MCDISLSFLWWFGDTLVMKRCIDDIVVIFRWYSGDVLARCWWCVSTVLAMFWWCVSDSFTMFWLCSGDVVIFYWCRDYALVMFRAVLAPFWAIYWYCFKNVKWYFVDVLAMDWRCVGVVLKLCLRCSCDILAMYQCSDDVMAKCWWCVGAV